MFSAVNDANTSADELNKEAIVFICFSVFKDQLTSISKYFHTLWADQIY